MTRIQAPYSVATVRTARQGRQRHLFRTAGSGFPTSLCGDAQRTPSPIENAPAQFCFECRLVAVTEMALALDTVGLHALAVQVGAAVRDLSYEVPAAQSEPASV